MSRGRFAGASLPLLAVLATFVAPLGCGRHPTSSPADPPTADAAPAAVAAEGPEVDLFFPGDGSRLHAERHKLAASATPVERLATVVAALLGGPTSPSLRAPLPDGAKLEAVYLWADGTAVVDLETPDGEAPQGWGSERELLAVYSLVNSVTANVPEARRVTLLWNGTQPPTFAGHVDTTRPLLPSPDLAAR